MDNTSGTVSSLMPSQGTSTLALLVLGLVLAVAVYVEVKENRIPNWLTLFGMAMGLTISGFAGRAEFLSSLGGLVVGFGFLFVFYLFGGVGGGDVKLMGTAGALLGTSLVLGAIFYTAILGAFLAAMLVIWRRDFWQRVNWRVRQVAFWQKGNKGQLPARGPLTVPYGIAIAIGCLAAVYLKGPS